jgi:putative hydrolase
VTNSPDENPFGGMPFFGDLAKAMASQGPLQWDVARQVALMTATHGSNSEANVDPASRIAVERLAPIAEMHVRESTTIDLGGNSRVQVVNRSMWTHLTLEAYKPMFQNLAESLSRTNEGSAIESDDPMANMFASLNKMIAPAMMGMSVGTMVGQLSLRAFGQYDLPVPRDTRAGVVVVAPNVESFAADWSIDPNDMRMWVLVHELTTHSLLAQEPVRRALSNALARYISGFRPNPDALMERLSGVEIGTDDPMSAMQRFFTDPSILLGAVRSPEQESLAPELDAIVAAIIGYVDHHVDQVANSLLGGGSRIAEAVRRRRVEASPQDTFVEQLLGLKLSPTQVERGTSFIDGVVERVGTAALTNLHTREGNLPTPNELAAPGLWLARLEVQ